MKLNEKREPTREHVRSVIAERRMMNLGRAKHNKLCVKPKSVRRELRRQLNDTGDQAGG